MKAIPRFLTILLSLLLCAHALAADIDSDSDDVQVTLAKLHKKRVIGGFITSAIGTTILIAPSFSNSLTSTDKVFLSFGGVTILLTGVKSLLTDSETERLLRRMEELRKAGKLTAEAEMELTEELTAFARSERYWGAAMAMTGGAISIVGGAAINDSFLKAFYFTLGGVAVLRGVMQLLRPSVVERLNDRTVAWDMYPTVLTAQRTSAPGMAVQLTF